MTHTLAAEYTYIMIQMSTANRVYIISSACSYKTKVSANMKHMYNKSISIILAYYSYIVI